MTQRSLRLICLLLALTLGSCSSSPPTGNSQPPTASPTIIAATLRPTQPATASSEPTLTLTPAPTATAKLQPTPTATPAPVANTLVLYTKVIARQTSPDPADLWERFYGLRTLPTLPFLDPAVFDAIYGKNEMMGEISMFFFDFRPRLSPDGRYVLVSGLASYPKYGVEGTGTWLIDLADGAARRLLPDGVIATWSGGSDAITYVEGNTLYTLNIAEGATPTPLFEQDNLWGLFAHWSPDGRFIATLAAVDPETTDPAAAPYAAALWLVPTNGEPARQLSVLEVFGMEYVTDQLSWSPDSQYLLALNKVFDLEGNLVSPDYPGGVYWLPDDPRLLLNSGGMSIITLAGEEVARIDDDFALEWVFSHDGRQLAYTQGGMDGPWHIAVYDLETGESRTILEHSGSPLRWSGDDRFLLLGTAGDEHGERPQIAMVSVEAGGEEQLLLDYAELVEVVPYPVR